jgi:D-3-phosphoglycerate dehydrogenase
MKSQINNPGRQWIMSKKTVLIEAAPFCAFDETPLRRLNDAGFECVDLRGWGMDSDEFVDALARADAILCGNDLRINDAVLEKAPNVRAVAKLGVGLDTVDIDAATRRGAVVFHTPGANDQAVADHTFALILAVARKIPYCDQSLREKRWEHTKIMGVGIWRKTLGLIGLGAIGRCVALRAKGFQMRVLAYDPYWPEGFAREQGVERASLDELLETSDIVSIHAPLTPENRGMIDAAALSKMKSSAILINVARGGIVNDSDLYDALKEGRIAGAGIDVFEIEPPATTQLPTLDNVVLTPHTAAFTFEGMNNMSEGVVDQLIDCFNGKKPAHIVNPAVFK